MKQCSYEECDNQQYARGYCMGHYRQLNRGIPLKRLYGGRYRGHKICAKCQKDKPLSDYYMQNGKPRSRCKACLSDDARVRRAK